MNGIKDPLRVLFLCIHNSARSQMAQAYLEKFGGARFHAESAGLEPGVLNPLAVEAMRVDGIDISSNPTRSVFDLATQKQSYHYVITVCDKEAADRCPFFPGLHRKISWSFDDPSGFTGSHDEKLARTCQVRDEIREAVLGFIDEIKAAPNP